MLYCGKFFYTKKHKLPDLNEINSDFNDQNSNQYQSTRFSNKDNYQFSSTKSNETRRNYNNNNNNNNANDTDYYPKSSINKNINGPISTNYDLQSKIKKTEKDQDQKKNVLTLHINYNEGNDSFNSKNKNSQYDYQPPDSFFHNKLEKQPPSMIKSHHHHKKKKVPENWPEIPQDVLNHRIDYQYSSPTKVPLEEEIKKLHKKKNNQRKQNRFSSPENSKGKIENSFGSTVEAQIEEEEEEFESDKMRNLNTSSKKTISDGSFSKTKKEDKNKLITDSQIEEEEEEYGNNNLENVANKYSSDKNSESYNTTNYSRYSNSYKSASSIPNEEEEFEVNKKSNYSKHKPANHLKGNTNSIATSPFYKPNLQFQQFNYNEEISELSQSQTIKPPQNGQPQNLSRSNRIKAKSNSKKQVAMTNKNSDSFHISKEEISLRPAKQSPNSFKDVSQDKSRSPKNYDEQAESPKSLKKKSPNLSSKSLSSSQSNSKSPPISNDQNKFETNYNYYDNKLSPQISNDQIITNDYDSMKDCFKYDSHEKTLSSQVINEISNLKSIRNKQKSSSNDTLSPQNNQRTSQIPNEQISQNSMNNKTPISSNSKESNSRSSKKKSRTSNSLKDSSSQSSSKSSQFANEQENISPPKKISPNSNSIKSNRSSKNNSRSPKDLNESKKSTSPKNKSHDTNIISSPQGAIEDQNEEEDEPIFFERLQLSEKEISNSDKYENSEPQPLNLPNGHFSSESYNIEENKENLSEVQEPHISDNELLEPNENDDHISIEIDQLENVNSINIDIAIEEEEEEHEMSQTNEEESLVMLSELQKTNDLSPLPKKKSLNYPVSINQLSSDETEVNDSATEINESFLHVPKAASKEQKSIILDEEDEETEEEKLNDDELSQSSKTFSSILTSKKPAKNNGDHLRHSNLVSSFEEVNDIEPITLDDPLIDNINVDEEEEEEVELLDESNEVTPNSLSTIHDNSDEMITTIQDVIFEEDFNIIPTDSNLLASDDPEEISLDHIPNKASNQANKTIKKQLNVDDDNDDDEIKKTGKDISDSLFSDSNKADMMLGESIQDDVHSSEIRYLIESTDQNRDEIENEEEEVSNSFEGIQSLSMKSIKEAHLVDLGDDDHEIFDFNDEFEEESNNSNRDVYEHSSFDKELKKVNDNQYSVLETTMLQSGTSNTNNLELIYNSIKFNHPSIRFGLRSIVSFSDRLLRKQLNNVI